MTTGTTPSVANPSPELLEMAANLRHHSQALAQLSDQQRQQILLAMAASLEKHRDQILSANQADLEAAVTENLAPALLARLKLDGLKLEAAIAGLKQLAQLPDPLGCRQLHRALDEGLILERISVPLGVVGVIFEARPDAVIQIAALAIRSGNGAILKGGREAIASCTAIIKALKIGLEQAEMHPDVLALLTSREESMALLKLDGLVDLIIPRGSNELVRFIQDNTRIPVLGHADGICHLYIDKNVDINQAVEITLDSKIQYPAACNALETLLIHREVAPAFLAIAIPALLEAGVELRGDAEAQSHGVQAKAQEADWSTEYLDLILAIKVVSNLDEAIAHIQAYGSRHTDGICTSDSNAAETFLARVDSAGVYHNCSTRFADGFRYGFGAEVGISTQTMPPRGPVGLEGLVTHRYRLRGSGQLVKNYASGATSFKHQDLPL
jgi:glutamate-5-semialdehyde dehydrogenase